MRQVLPLVMLAPALAGCSLIYNPNNLPNPNAIADAEIILDADPSKLELIGVAPATIYEGQGDGNSAPALVVISGHQMVDANTTVELTPAADTPLPDGVVMPVVGAPIVAKDGNWIAIPVTVRVDGMLGKGQLIKLDVQVSQDIKAQPGVRSTQRLEAALKLQGLDELVVPTGTTTVMLGTDMLDAMYSKIELGAPVQFTGSNRVLLTATSSITTKGLIADGAAGPATTGQLGGCAGGGPASDGDCGTTLGGRKGAADPILGGAGGGGGGGAANDGGKGTGTGAGNGGTHTGDPLISTFTADGTRSPNQSGGGGGGGKPTIGGSNGAGGAGGGWIRIDAGGDIAINGAISAKGGTGQDGGASGGGGGAGGMVVIRADAALAVTGAITVTGGKGGGGGGKGGDGSAGRVRWDAVTGSAPSAPGAGSTRRGPAFVLADRVLRDNKAPITLNGSNGDQFNVRVINFGVDGTNATNADQLVFSADTATLKLPPLPQGLNQICVTSTFGTPNTPEADKCAFVAFLP